jgi:hypothetical protein
MTGGQYGAAIGWKIVFMHVASLNDQGVDLFCQSQRGISP